MSQSEKPDTRRPEAAASAVLFRGEAVLLIERDGGPNEGHWSLPGGTIGMGETAEDAARREVEEETGLTSKIEGLAGVYDVIDHDDAGNVVLHYVIATYFGRANDGEPRARGDAREARFVALDAVKDLKLTHGTQFVIEHAWRLLAAGCSEATGTSRIEYNISG
jgi:ADP-ribose pyrophosphatase YjhB (NUDIX family)